MSDNFDPMTANASRLKSWLKANKSDGTVVDNQSIPDMKAAVVRRKRRLEMEEGEEQPRGQGNALTLTQFKEKTSAMLKNNYGPKTSFVINAKCVRIELPLTVKRCGPAPGCRGMVKNGVCVTCHRECVGQDDFYVAFDLVDLEDPEVTLNVVGYKCAAESFFKRGIAATTVAAMTKSEVLDQLEPWMETAVNVHAVVTYEPDKGYVRISPHTMSRLPVSFMKEYS